MIDVDLFKNCKLVGNSLFDFPNNLTKEWNKTIWLYDTTWVSLKIASSNPKKSNHYDCNFFKKHPIDRQSIK